MQLEIDHDKYYDWELATRADLQPGDVAVASHHGPNFALRQVLRDAPTTTFIDVPDSDLERMVADHEEGVKNARTGYTCVQEGGPNHGQEVVVAPRNLPLKSLPQLLHEHLANAVVPFHSPAEEIRAVRLLTVPEGWTEEQRVALEGYLAQRFVASGGLIDLPRSPAADPSPPGEAPAPEAAPEAPQSTEEA